MWEKNSRVLRNVLNNSSLATNEAEFVRLLESASASMWESRRERLENLKSKAPRKKRKVPVKKDSDYNQQQRDDDDPSQQQQQQPGFF